MLENPQRMFSDIIRASNSLLLARHIDNTYAQGRLCSRYYIKWVTTSWTYSNKTKNFKQIFIPLMFSMPYFVFLLVAPESPVYLVSRYVRTSFGSPCKYIDLHTLKAYVWILYSNFQHILMCQERLVNRSEVHRSPSYSSASDRLLLSESWS